MKDGAAQPDFRVFPKEWGAEFIRDGEARFRLWAPGVDALSLILDGKGTPMAASGEGWFELLATGVSAGVPYAFGLPDGARVPDPASRAQREDVHGPSLLVDPTSYRWRHAGWRGRPWEEAVLYELHVGTFTPEGTFAAARERLAYLADLGVTAIEIMPVAHFSGNRGWGYDGVLLYAPHPAYGAPDEMKAFVDAAHGLGLMVILDVVYNHFGPDGNHIGRYAPDFFHSGRHTPWGAAIAYERAPVRRFFVENALYWLEEYFLDGLRFDAVDNVRDEVSDPEILVEIAERVRAAFPERAVHLTTEDNRNVTHLHARGPSGETKLHTAEWNDDFHNAVHVLATGEAEGYYADFAEDGWGRLGRALAEGFAYQGEVSRHSGGVPRGEPSAHLPPTAFIDFLQNHDQVGNRALGERLGALAPLRTVEILTAMLLLSPHVPMLFMGEEYAETRPFLFFTDFTGDLADAVREGRRREFAHFAGFRGGKEDIPDPNALETFAASRLDWRRGLEHPGKERLALVRRLLDLRRDHVVPLLRGAGGHAGRLIKAEDGVIAVDWALTGGTLQMRANLGGQEGEAPPLAGTVIYADPPMEPGAGLPPLSIVVGSGTSST